MEMEMEMIPLKNASTMNNRLEIIFERSCENDSNDPFINVRKNVPFPAPARVIRHTRPVLQDIMGYIWATFWMVQCLYKGKIQCLNFFGFLLLYCVFVIMAIIMVKLKASNKKLQNSRISMY